MAKRLSPPYWGLRSYLADDHPMKPLEIGSEATPDEYVASLVGVFREVRRVLRDDGTLWLNLGDSYATNPGNGRGGEGSGLTKGGKAPHRSGMDKTQIGLKPKDLIGVPWLVAFALRSDGWWLRQDIIWSKPNPMPESVADRCTKAHEYLFLLSKSERYYYDADAVAEPYTAGTIARCGGAEERAHNHRRGALGKHQGTLNVNGGMDPNGKRNRRSVWTVASQPYDGAHFATFPPKLIEPCILAGSRPGDLVLDPFFGSGTTGQVAEKHGRRWIGFDLGYERLAKERTAQRSLALEASHVH